MSGGYGGATGSVSVNVDQFEESEETKKDFGEQQLTYTIGGDSLPEPIQLKLLGIEETLKPKFWSNLDELTKLKPCKRMSLTKLGKFLKNMGTTIEKYPEKMGVKRAKGIYMITRPFDIHSNALCPKSFIMHNNNAYIPSVAPFERPGLAYTYITSYRFFTHFQQFLTKCFTFPCKFNPAIYMVVISHHITSRHITSHHVTSRHVISYCSQIMFRKIRKV